MSMAKKIYLGNGNSSRNCSKLYVGVGSTARKITKGYIGVGNVAKQFYPIYSWQKYTITTTKQWVDTRDTYRTNRIWQVDWEWVRGDTDGSLSAVPLPDCYRTYTIDQSTGDYILSGSTVEPPYRKDATLDISGYYIYTRPDGHSRANFYELTEIEVDHWYATGDDNYSWETTCNGYRMIARYQDVQTAGTFIETVFGSSESQYPANGVHTDGYWYIRN